MLASLSLDKILGDVSICSSELTGEGVHTAIGLDKVRIAREVNFRASDMVQGEKLSLLGRAHSRRAGTGYCTSTIELVSGSYPPQKMSRLVVCDYELRI